MKKILSLLLLLMVAGCQGTGSNDEASYETHLDDKPANMKNTTSHNNRDEVRDVSDRNPNFLNLRGTSVGDEGHGNRNDFGNDIDKAKDIVNKTKDFQAESIWINNSADRMTINVNSTRRLEGEERDQAIGRLQQKLTQALPRYTIDIRER